MKLQFATLSFFALATTSSAFAPVTASKPSFGLKAYSTEAAGEAATESFRLKFKDDSGVISPWHDIPLKDGDAYNMVVEM